MQADEAEDRGRDEEHVRRVEAREGRAADIAARDDETREPAAYHGCARGLLCRDDDSPERVLVPTQELSGERHGQSREEQEGAREPVRLARELERPEEIDLRHVREDEDHHRAGAEVVHPAHDRPQRRVVADELERVVRAVRRGHVRHREPDTCDDLHHEDRERRAAEHVPPADGPLEVARDRMTQDRHDRVLELEALTEPARDLAGYFSDRAHPAHPCFTVGSGCWRTRRRSPLTSHSRSKSGRGGGPPATVPSL